MVDFHPEGHLIAEAAARGGWDVGAQLPYHLPNCFGCGPQNEVGLGLRTTVVQDDAIEAELTFEHRFEGAPGLAHGGAIAALFDDLFGSVLMRVLALGVTTELTVRYRRPVRLDRSVHAVARLDHRDDRDLYVSGELEQDGEVVATATGIFRTVPAEHVFGNLDGA